MSATTPTGQISYEPVHAAMVRPLRGEVLRPGEAPERLIYPGDEEPGTLHMAAFRAGEVVGIVTVMADGHPSSPRPGDWRIRGMATAASMRNAGIGSDLLTRCETHAREQQGTRLWCNARIGARTLYERIGMTVGGEVFEIAGIGEHYLMSKRLD
jgi:ribosomal protein S18 acetylase RimI-like enzyme